MLCNCNNEALSFERSIKGLFFFFSYWVVAHFTPWLCLLLGVRVISQHGNNYYIKLCWKYASSSLHRYILSLCLDENSSTIYGYIYFLETDKLFSKVVCNGAFPQQVHERSNGSTSWLTPATVRHYSFSHSTSCGGAVPLWLVICISLMINDVEPFITCSFTILFSLLTCLCNSLAHFWKHWITVCLLSLRGLFIFYLQILCQMGDK